VCLPSLEQSSANASTCCAATAVNDFQVSKKWVKFDVAVEIMLFEPTNSPEDQEINAFEI
jgi:hypothetical protein